MNALFFTLGGFALILVLARLKVPLAIAIIVGALAVGLLFGLGPAHTILTALRGTVEPKSIALAVVTVLLLSLCALMQACGLFEQIVSQTRSLVRRPSVTIAVLPAMIGMLPMPGGALFSAPMVESAAGKPQGEAGLWSAINYWFRHVWEYWWPLYPGAILAFQISQDYMEGGYGRFVLFHLPLSAFMVLSGLLLLRKAAPHLPSHAGPRQDGSALKLLAATSPIWTIILVWALLKPALMHWVCPYLSQDLRPLATTYAPIAAGLLVSMVLMVLIKRITLRVVGGALGRWSIYKMASLVVAVMIFQYVLKEVDATARIAAELQSKGVPIVLVAMTLPFVAGMVTGLAIGFVGTSFPIVLGLVAATPDCGPIRPYLVLAYAFGHMGQMMSPLHLCHIVSNEYFKTPFAPVYRWLIPLGAITGLLATGYFALLRATM